MKKILITLVILLLIVTTFVNMANAKTDVQNNFYRARQRGPLLDKLVDFLKKIPFINKTINFLKSLLGLREDADNIEEVDDFDGGYKPYYQDVNEPGSETPTDTGISVSIKNFDLQYTNEENYLEFDMTFSGSTSGDVYACYWITVSYYDDGTSDYANIWMSPIKESNVDIADYSFESTFIGTGPDGDNDWSTFRGRQYVSGAINLDEAPFYTPKTKQDKTLEDVRLYVRAFSDKDLNKWNQDSISMMDELTGTVYADTEKDKEDDGLPGFELMLFIAAISISLILLKKRK